MLEYFIAFSLLGFIVQDFVAVDVTVTLGVQPSHPATGSLKRLSDPVAGWLYPGLGAYTAPGIFAAPEYARCGSAAGAVF